MLSYLLGRAELESPGEGFAIFWLSVVLALCVVLIHSLWFCEGVHSLHIVCVCVWGGVR